MKNISLSKHNYLLQTQEENRTAHQRGLLGEEELLVLKHPVLSEILKEKKIRQKENNFSILTHKILNIKY